ncbi:serine hydrolase domain-containing protein [Mycobacteroides sp. LB1]|uniref:serine hydrolase domain-containing protein n=1 Tax=Mycobacteroides sp. LB1 TaxID=2750814 RepID=UPI0015DF00F3|nr:beta-lactamase family protein [Mycobacteroides sp. LB1]
MSDPSVAGPGQSSSDDIVGLPGLRLSAAVSGWARPEFASVVKMFGWLFTKYRYGGGGLCVYVDGEPALDIWAGDAAPDREWTQDTGPTIFSASKGITTTVIHRLVDRGLLSYDAPVARYWTEFGANGKSSITVRQLLNHEAGLSRLTGIASASDLSDHLVMEKRLAAAPVDRFHRKPAYHALSIGWLLAGLARSVTGKDMRELYRTEIAEPLGVDGIHLGFPPEGSPTTRADMYPNQDRLLRREHALRAGLFLGMGWVMKTVLNHVPGIRGAADTIYVPGFVRYGLNGGTADSLLYNTQAPAISGVATAPALAKLYAALASEGSVDGRRLLSPEITAGLARPEPDRRLDHTLGLPLGYHLGYHSLQIPAFGFDSGFGFVGAGGSTGWADQKRCIAVGFTTNRLVRTIALDQLMFLLMWPRIVRAARS